MQKIKEKNYYYKTEVEENYFKTCLYRNL